MGLMAHWLMQGFDGTDRPPLPELAAVIRGGFAEFVAMTLFVFFGCGAASSELTQIGGEWDPAATLMVAMQFGLAITVLAYATAHSSGGHINCAVTWCLMLVGKCHPFTAIVYLICQIIGSITGALFLSLIEEASHPDYIIGAPPRVGANSFQHETVMAHHALLGEFMGTFLLCLVVLETAVNPQAVTQEGGKTVKGNKMNLAPIPIGFAVFIAHVVLIPLDGCSINPTRSFGPSYVGKSWDNHWIFWIGPLLGATGAALCWGLMARLQVWQDATELEAARAAADGQGEHARAHKKGEDASGREGVGLLDHKERVSLTKERDVKAPEEGPKEAHPDGEMSEVPL